MVTGKNRDYLRCQFFGPLSQLFSAFWLISLGHGFTSMIILAIFAHLGLLMQDKGFAAQDAIL